MKKYFSYPALIVIGVLVCTNIFILFFPVKTPDVIASFVERYPYIDVSRNFIAQEHFISTLQPLREYLQELVQKEGSQSISIYFEYLNTGANISINQDLRVFPASLVKVPLALAVMKKIEKGDWSLGNELILTKDDRDYAWGDVYKHPIGTRLTIEKLLEEMLVNSDNTAFRILYRNLSFDELQDVVKAVGLDDLFNEEGKITAKEFTRLLRVLYVSSYLNPEHSQWILETLSRTPYAEYLGQGIPQDVMFAHKIGENDDTGVILDAGIVYLQNRPYLITVLIDYKKDNMGKVKALNIMKDIAERAYSYILNYENN